MRNRVSRKAFPNGVWERGTEGKRAATVRERVSRIQSLTVAARRSENMPDEEYQKEPPRPARPLPRPRSSADYDDDDIRIRRPDAVETFIPYKNPMGLTAYYLGVFSFIPCLGLALGPAALIFGILGVRYRKRHPTAGGVGHAISGIVMGSLTSLANFGVLIAMAVGVGIAAWK
jgi:hypothetical protein